MPCFWPIEPWLPRRRTADTALIGDHQESRLFNQSARSWTSGRRTKLRRFRTSGLLPICQESGSARPTV